MRTIFALFESYSEAKAAVLKLIERDFDEAGMSVIVQELTARGAMDVNFRTVSVEKTGTPARDLTPGLDRLLAGRKAVVLPDVGPVYAAGAAASIAAGSTGREKSPGPLKEVLVDLGVPRELAEFYANGVREGGVLFWIRTDEGRVAEAADILSSTKGEEVANYG